MMDLMFLKYGFGRANQDASIEIRRGALSRDQAINLVKLYDGLFPEQYLELYLNYYQMKKEDFFEVLDSWANKDILEKIDNKCSPKTIIASNTSSISITKLAESTKRMDKVIGMHFMNPVPIMKLVEIINSKYTSKETTEKISSLSKKLEKIPLIVNDSPGFISNRILIPMINEAIEALDQKVATVKNIDGIMKLGMGHPMGPLQLADLIGLDVCKSILDVMFEGFKDSKYKANRLLVKLVEDGKLGMKSGEGFYDYSNSRKAEFVSKRFLNDC